jgi:hypothetical protein
MTPSSRDEANYIGAINMLARVIEPRLSAASASRCALEGKAEAKKRQIIVKESGASIRRFSDISSVKTKSSRRLDLQISSWTQSAGPLVFTRRATAQPFGRIL